MIKMHSTDAQAEGLEAQAVQANKLAMLKQNCGEVEDGARTLNRSSLLHPCKTSRLSGEVTSSERSVRLAASRPPVHEDTRKDQFHRMRGEDSSSILRAIHAERNLNIAGMANNGYQGR
ncbi:hypothetical protein WJX84_002800 [Apatococcus fuscideae]|uniref:Uncharacterized protein n=1 Tax=Apatococcus fuscideae TaxID=2026836 RepID=A0AAW1SD24_9CHLO